MKIHLNRYDIYMIALNINKNLLQFEHESPITDATPFINIEKMTLVCTFEFGAITVMLVVEMIYVFLTSMFPKKTVF